MVSMDLEVLKWLSMAVLSFFGWLMKMKLSDQDKTIRAIQEDLRAVNGDLQNVKQTHLHKDDFKEFKIELREMFESIRSDIRNIRDRDMQ
jgi:hypothetical protein